MDGESILVKTFEIYPAPSYFASDLSLTFKEIQPTREGPGGRLWRVAFPFDVWVWEADARPFDAKPLNGQPWKPHFAEFPAEGPPQHTWELALAPRKGKKVAEGLAEAEGALSEWLFQLGPAMNAEERRDAWRARTDAGEEAFIFGTSRGVYTGPKIPSRSFICLLLQRLYFDQMDKRLGELSQKTSTKLGNLFKVTPLKLLQHSELADLSTQISSIRLNFESIVEPLSCPRKFFAFHSDRKFYSTLIDELDLDDEVEGLSDQLETLEDIYEVMGERVTEYRYFFIECVLEVAIVFILLWEIYVMYQELAVESMTR